MADRIVKVILDASVAKFQSSMRAAVGSVKDFSSNTSKYLKDHEQSVSNVSSGLIKFGVVGVAAAGMVIKKFADFDEAMSSVQAATHESAENMGLLRDAAVAAGADTQYSATEAAGAIEELAKAGISTKDILGGGLSGALNLAAAGSMGVSDAAESAASALVMFGLKGSDVNHVADLLAAGAGKAQGEVSDLSAALNNVGTVASNTGLSIEETTGFLAAMASYGLTGAEAGTQFKSMLLSLQGPSSTAQKALDELGLSLYDSEGKTKSLTQFVGEYKASLEGKTQAEKDSYNSTIFGSYGINAANVAYKEGAEGISSWIDAVNDAGFASETAAARTDNLKGDIERLGGSFETLFIQSGSGVNGALRGIVQAAEWAVDALGKIPEPILSATTQLVGAGGLVTLGLGGLGKLAVGINNAKTAVEGLGISFKTAGIAAGAVGAALTIGTLALAAWAKNAAEAKARTDAYIDTLDALGNITDSTMSQINAALSADNRNWAEKLFGDGGAKSLIDDAEKLGLSVDDLTEYITGNKGSVDKLNAAWAEYSTQAESSSFDFYHFKGALDDQANSLTNAQKQALQKAQADKEAGIASDDASASTDSAADALAAYSAKAAEGTATVEDYTNALTAQIDAMKEQAEIYMSADEAQANWAQRTADNAEALKKLTGYTDENGNAVEGLGKATTEANDAWDLYTEAGQLASKTMRDTADDALVMLEKMRAAGSGPEELRQKTQDARDELIKTATQMELDGDAAEALADRYGLIPEQVVTKMDLDDRATSPLREVARRIASTPDHTSWIGISDGASGPLLSIRQQIANLPAEKRIRVFLDQVGFVSPSVPSSIRLPGHATGGAIVGPGTGTSDSVLIRASNGEHMLTASDVQAMGGQAAVYQMRRDIHSGRLQGYAEGGAIPLSAQTTPSSFYSQPRVSVAAPSLDGLSISGSLDVNGALVPLIDGRIRANDKRNARL